MNKTFITFLLSSFISLNVYANFNFSKDFSLKKIDINQLSSHLTKEIFSSKKWPKILSFNDKEYSVDFSFKDDLKRFIKKELRRYGSDYASVVVLDNNTGKILSAIDYTKETKSFGKNLSFSATNPAASVFKVITAADLIENAKMDDSFEFNYNGKATTLYKYQLKDKKTKWTRKTTLKRAFARSNNVVFGKAAIEHSNYKNLISMAQKFGFNKDLMQFVNIGSSKVLKGKTNFSLAELASGFNKQTLISPIHGAVIASIVANDGVFIKPSIVEKIEDKKHELLIWKPKKTQKRVLSKDAALELKELMQSTVSRGTARGSFRKRKKSTKDIIIGGKTGTITGGLPYGKRDWFVSYAMPKNSKDKGISICVMIVNVKKWYIKSPALAKNIIEYYYSNFQKIGKI